MKKLLAFAMLFAPLAVCSADDNAGWEKLGEKNGIISYRKEIPGSPIVAFKGEALIDAPIAKVAGVLEDIKRSPEWVDHMVDNHIVRAVTPHEVIEYRHIGTPIVMKDRDFVNKIRWEWDKPNRAWYMHFVSVEDPAAPKTHYVRGTVMNTGYKLEPRDNGTKTYLWVEVHADPKGWVPKWVVNLFQRSWAPSTIRAIQKQVLKPDVLEDPELKNVT